MTYQVQALSPAPAAASTPLRVVVVVLRYGSEVVGGAESQARGFAEEAARQGWEVEVWTTCAQSHYTWENVYPAGSSWSGGVRVRRFPVEVRELERQHALEWELGTRQRLPRDKQYLWLEGGAHSPALYDHVARHASEWDALVVLPYALPMMHLSAWAAPERVVMWPCLHDEPYAYLEPVRLLLESVGGVMFNSPEERDLAIERLRIQPRHHAVLGEGVTLATPEADSGSAAGNLLYVGRLEGGKNLALLYEYMQRYVSEGGEGRLVVMGAGPMVPPEHPAFDYRGFVSEQAKADALASALALCQPSLNESFSLTMMESWLGGRPALVHSDCVVTRGHVQRSKGGLWFRTYGEFAGALEWFRAHPREASQMGQNGSTYVLSNYTWQAVVGRFERLLRAWNGMPVASSATPSGSAAGSEGRA